MRSHHLISGDRKPRFTREINGECSLVNRPCRHDRSQRRAADASFEKAVCAKIRPGRRQRGEGKRKENVCPFHAGRMQVGRCHALPVGSGVPLVLSWLTSLAPHTTLFSLQAKIGRPSISSIWLSICKPTRFPIFLVIIPIPPVWPRPEPNPGLQRDLILDAEYWGWDVGLLGDFSWRCPQMQCRPAACMHNSRMFTITAEKIPQLIRSDLSQMTHSFDSKALRNHGLPITYASTYIMCANAYASSFD